MNNPSSLLAAVWQRRTDLLLSLLAAGADPNESTANGDTPLMLAARQGEVEVATALIAAGADVHRLNFFGLSALCDAASNGSDEAIAIMRMLLDAGADVDQGRPSTPLMCASADSVAAMEILLDTGANPNATRPNWGTVLHVCVHYDNWLGVKSLLARGADPSLVVLSSGGGDPLPTARELARHKQRKAIIALLEGKPLAVLSDEQILRQLERLAADSQYELRAGAAGGAVSELVDTVAVAISPLLLEMYRRADGQEWTTELSLVARSDERWDREWYWMPLEETVTHWREWTEALDGGAFDSQRNLKSDPGVVKAWWDRGWIPLLSDGGGGYVCLDFAPTINGTSGQVILVEHDSPTRRLLANSLPEYLSIVEFENLT